MAKAAKRYMAHAGVWCLQGSLVASWSPTVRVAQSSKACLAHLRSKPASRLLYAIVRWLSMSLISLVVVHAFWTSALRAKLTLRGDMHGCMLN